MTPRLTVVVAVFNPGLDIQPLLQSLDEQTMPPGELEIVFCDDDSTDGSRQMLQEWVRDRPGASVLHLTPNSGWPSRPRNRGIEAATGEYIFFADHDDRFAPRAAEAMVEYADRTTADVVLVKEVGVGEGRGVPSEIFRRSVPDAVLGRDPLLKLLTPHKLFRTAMVREHELRFPEGRVRLEDHAFVVAAYFAARRIAIFADEDCYLWLRREHGTNATFHRFDVETYLDSVARVLEIVERHTEPGPLRAQLCSQWYRAKMLRLLEGDRLRRRRWSEQRRLLSALRRVAGRFDLGVAQWPFLGAAARVRSALVERGSLWQIRWFGYQERGIEVRAVVRDEQVAGDHVRVRVDAVLVDRRGQPILLDAVGTGWAWRPSALGRVPIPLPEIDVTDLRESPRAVLRTVDGSGRRRPVPRHGGGPLADRRVGASATFDVPVEAWSTDRGAPQVVVRLSALGWAREIAIGPSAPTPSPPSPMRIARAIARVPYRAARTAWRMVR